MLPHLAAAGRVRAQPIQCQTGVSRNLELHGLRVLIIEDVSNDSDLAIHQLARGGIRCVHVRADTESNFRTALSRFRPHVILSDFSLPAFDGLAALKIANTEAPDVPFIFLSGTLGEERAIEALRRGAVDYVLKSNPARLVPAVRRALREVSERARRRIAERQIRENEQRLRDIVHTSQDWIWELDLERRFIFCSDAVQGILGIPLSQVIGASYELLIHPDDRDGFAAVLEGLNAGHRTTTGAATRWKHASGDYRWLEGNLLALIGPDGRVSGYRGTHRDVTERKHQQERISRLTRMVQMQSGINAAVVRIRERDALLREACRVALQVGGYSQAMIAFVTADGRRAQPWYR